MNASLLWNTCIELCASIIFVICPRTFINSSNSIERNILEAVLGLIRRLPLLYVKIWTNRGAYRLLFFNKKKVLFRV